MRKRMRPIVLILISVILLIGVTGCMDTTNSPEKEIKKDAITTDSAKQEVLSALSQKYGKTFECVAYEEPSIINNKYTFCVVESGLNYDGYGFTAYFNPDSDTKISDGYFEILIRNELSELLYKNGLTKEAKVFAETSLTSFDNSLNGSSTLADASKIYDSLRVYYYIFLPNGCQINALKSKIMDGFITGKICYYEIPLDICADLTFENYSDVIAGINDGKISVNNKGSFVV